MLCSFTEVCRRGHNSEPRSAMLALLFSRFQNRAAHHRRSAVLTGRSMRNWARVCICAAAEPHPTGGGANYQMTVRRRRSHDGANRQAAPRLPPPPPPTQTERRRDPGQRADADGTRGAIAEGTRRAPASGGPTPPADSRPETGTPGDVAKPHPQP